MLDYSKINRDELQYKDEKSFIEVLPTLKDENILRGIRPSPKYDYSIQTPFSFVCKKSVEKYKNKKVAVIAHIFYTDLLQETMTYINNIPVKTDIFISTDTQLKSQEIEKALGDYKNGKVVVKVCKNRGRDVAPMLIDFREVFFTHEWILHVHSKKSPHNDSELFGWRHYLFKELLGSKEKVLSIFHLLESTDVGIVFPEHYEPVKKSLNFGYNYPTMKEMLSKLNISYYPNNMLEFPSSTMLWFKSKALRPLVNLKLNYEDFDKEEGQIDGTLAHSIERSLLLICEASQYRWCKICSTKNNHSKLIAPNNEEDVENLIKTLFYPILGNQILIDDHRQIREFDQIKTCKDANLQPRLNIVLPTLNKEKIFGGISTALKFFNNLKEHLGNDFQYRILIVSEVVNPDDIDSFQEYHLINLHSRYDDFDNSIVDVKRSTDGYLGLRQSDFFIATAWWTAINAYSFCSRQKEYFATSQKVIYLIQDHEPGFYNWSSQYMLARSTYAHIDDTIAVINSEELANYMLKRYNFINAFVLPFTLNETLQNTIKSSKKEKIILFYGRPSVERNAFGLIIDALYEWQNRNPILAQEWKIISLGESYPKWRVKHIKNISIEGKVSLEEYAQYLNRASVGISLMTSPHPSYPPLEMAYANIKTITNKFEEKDLSKRHFNIVSIELGSAHHLSESIEKVVESITFDKSELSSVAHINSKMNRYSVGKLCKIIKQGV